MVLFFQGPVFVYAEVSIMMIWTDKRKKDDGERGGSGRTIHVAMEMVIWLTVAGSPVKQDAGMYTSLGHYRWYPFLNDQSMDLGGGSLNTTHPPNMQILKIIKMSQGSMLNQSQSGF